MSTYVYTDELERIKDLELRAELDRLIGGDDRIPTGPLGAWALAYARWRAGARASYPAPPSGASKVTLEGIARVDELVRELVPFRQRRLDPDVVYTDDLAHGPRRAGAWDPTA